MKKNLPPKLPLHFFRWFCHPKLRDHIEGDLMELYEERKIKSGKRRADFRFVIDVLLLFRPGIIKPTEGYKKLNNYGMLKSYFKIGWRNLLKNKGYSFINIGGLAVGMAAFLLIIHYVRFERSYEDFNPNANNIYRITMDIYKGSEYVVTDCETHAPLGPMTKEKMPEVKEFVRMFSSDGLRDIKVGERRFLEAGVYYADPSAFKILSLKVLYGNPATALTDPMQAVLTASIARKYFGRTDVVGETFKKEEKLFHITSVIEDTPPNTHLKFSILISHSSLLKLREGYTEDNWDGNNEYTYLLMDPGTDIQNFNKKLSTLSASLKGKVDNMKYVAEPIKNIHLYSNKTFEPEVNGSAKMVFFLLIIACFIIFIAWINYINLSTARAIERAREVGIRKVMGSIKSQLIFQFLSESILVNLLAGIFALGLFQMLLPMFRNLTGQPLAINVIGDSIFWYLFIALISIGASLSGIYPAFVLSSFQPVAVLKGKFRSSSHGQLLRKGLVVFQFGATVMLLVCMLTVYLQINYLRNSNLGMNIDQTLVIRAPRSDLSDAAFNSIFQSLTTELLRSQDVKMVARSESLPGLSLNELNSNSIARLGQQRKAGDYIYYLYGIDADFIPVMGMKLAAGRNFEIGKPNYDHVILNEEAMEKLGFSNAEEAIGAKLTFQTRWPGEPATVIGVVKNFYQRSPKEKHIPMLFTFSNQAAFFSIKLNSKNVHETVTSVKATYDHVFPNTVFDYFFLDEKFNQQYQADAQFGQVIAVFSGLAVFIACLGLFGLSSYTIIQRTKEIGIRKVSGASVSQIVRLLSQDFAKVIIIGAIVALPFAYWAMKEWLSNYEVRINLSAWVFVLPILLILLIAWITVSFQTIKTAIANPVDSLKSE